MCKRDDWLLSAQSTRHNFMCHFNIKSRIFIQLDLSLIQAMRPDNKWHVIIHVYAGLKESAAAPDGDAFMRAILFSFFFLG